jgi:hypothetical protein
VQQRPIQAGDLLVWYTDGVIDAIDPTGDAFGDRRLQRLLRKLEGDQLAPAAVHDRVHAAIVAHRAGRPRPDDETLVIARVGARPVTEAPVAGSEAPVAGSEAPVAGSEARVAGSEAPVAGSEAPEG